MDGRLQGTGRRNPSPGCKVRGTVARYHRSMDHPTHDTRGRKDRANRRLHHALLGLALTAASASTSAQGTSATSRPPPAPPPIGRYEASALQVGSVTVTYRLDTGSGQVRVCADKPATCRHSHALVPVRRWQRNGQFRIVSTGSRLLFIDTAAGTLHRCATVGVNGDGELTGSGGPFACGEHL